MVTNTEDRWLIPNVRAKWVLTQVQPVMRNLVLTDVGAKGHKRSLFITKGLKFIQAPAVVHVAVEDGGVSRPFNDDQQWLADFKGIPKELGAVLGVEVNAIVQIKWLHC